MIKNLTPHTVTVLDEDNNIVKEFASCGIARAKQTIVPAGMVDGVPLVTTTFGEPVDLPEREEGVFLIVSLATAKAAETYGRTTEDLLLTCSPVRDDAGRIIGCRSLATV